MQRTERRYVARCAVQVGLQAHPHVAVSVLEPPVERQRRLDVARILHVDPQPAAEPLRLFDQPRQAGLGARRVDVESEVRQLHGDLRIQAQPLDGAEGVGVFLCSGLG